MMKIEPSQLLRIVCTVVVAAVFLLAGGQKVIHNHETGTMLAAYLKSPDSVRALGCVEIGLALWLLSFRMPKAAQLIAAGVLMIFTLMLLRELASNAPLPCGCLETRPGQDAFAIRTGLKLSVGRNVVLIFMSVVAILLAGPEPEPSKGGQAARGRQKPENEDWGV